jgi:iron complex outermembrane recepter protein
VIRRAIAALASVHAAWVWAGAEGTLTEADYFSEQPVVLSASKLSQPVSRAPAAVTVITREMIEASGFRHLVDVLRLVPGFVVGWSGGNMPAATYLGLSDAFPHWMQIMVDGRSVYNQAFGHTNWRAIPLMLDEVDRIEVVRGPNAANDGLNSMLGTIHIFTRHSATTQGGMAEVAAGQKGFREVNLRYGGEAARGSWRLGLLGREDQRHGVSLDHASDVQLSFRGDIQPTHRDDVMLQVGASRGFGQGGNAGYVFNEDQRAYVLSGFANLRWTRALGEGQEWSMRLHHTFYQNKENVLPPPPLSFADPLNANARVSGSGIQFTYLNQAASDLRTSVSGEYYLSKLYGPYFLDDDAGVSDRIVRLSGAAEWSLSPKWIAHAGAMLEHHSDPSGTHFSPRLTLNWLPSSEHAFRFGASRGVSALGLFANHTNLKFTVNGAVFDQLVLSTGDLKPEMIDSAELGYLFNKPAWSLNLDLRAFHNRITDIVDPITVPYPDPDGLDVYVNKGTITQNGLEYQLRWRPGPQGWLVLSQSWVRTDDDQNNLYARSVPRYTLSLLAARPVAGFDASVGYYHAGKMRWIGWLAPSEYESRYNRLDLRVAKGWKTAAGEIEAALVVQALLGGEKEAFHYYGPQEFKRRGYLSLKYEFK